MLWSGAQHVPRERVSLITAAVGAGVGAAVVAAWVGVFVGALVGGAVVGDGVDPCFFHHPFDEPSIGKSDETKTGSLGSGGGKDGGDGITEDEDDAGNME